MENCIFCAIVSGAMSSEKVYEDDQTVAFMDINPASLGHSLVIPKQHVCDLTDVDVEDLKAMASTAQRVGKALVGGLGAAGVNLMLSSGRAAFQSVFHIHFHVIPRYPDDHIRLPWIPAPGDPKVIADAGWSLRSTLAQD